MAGKKSDMLAHKIKNAQVSIGGQTFTLDTVEHIYEACPKYSELGIF